MSVTAGRGTGAHVAMISLCLTVGSLPSLAVSLLWYQCHGPWVQRLAAQLVLQLFRRQSQCLPVCRARVLLHILSSKVLQNVYINLNIFIYQWLILF